MILRPKLLCFLDLEATGLDPKQDEILEIAYVVTEFLFPYREVSRGHFLVCGPGRIALLSGQCDPIVQDMHERSGLKEDLVAIELTRTISSVEAELLTLSQDWPTSGRKVSLAGFGPKFDLDFLRRHAPRFAARLSHQVFDVTSLKLQCLSLGMPEEGTTESAHRAAADVDASIARARTYLRWLTHRLANHQSEDSLAVYRSTCRVCRVDVVETSFEP